MSNLVEKDKTDVYEQNKSDINQLKQQIQMTKEKIFRFYTVKGKAEAFLNESDDEDIASTFSSSNFQLKQSFSDKIMQLKCNEDGSLITIVLHSNSNSSYGFNLEKTNNRKWSLEKCYLPSFTTVNIDHFKKEINHLTLSQVHEFLEDIQRNIVAYNIRENHVKQLKEIMDTRIRLYHCLRYIELEFTFKVFNKETKIRRSLTVRINFDLLSVKAGRVTCKINFDEDEEMKDFFTEHFKIFRELDIISAYKEAFKNVDIYEFFV